jgi:hypothetical protein
MMDRIEVNAEDGLKLTADALAQKNYLGDPDVVDRLVRDFLSAALSLLTDVETGDASAEDAPAKLVDLAKSYAGIFLGESAAYVAQPWNSPNRLGLFLRAKKPPHLEDYDRPADAYFAAIASAAIMHAQAVEEGTLPEGEAQEALTEIRNDAVRTLLGIR